jgi:hypothetical protein
MVNSIELTGIGAGQARDWKYEFGQVQFRKSGFYWQAFMNRSNAGDTYLLRTGVPLIDKSTVFSTQAQYAFNPTDMLEVIGGVDLIKTTPQTGGTINGLNEDIDETLEVGGYVSATLAVSDRVDLVGALRADHHEHLEDPVLSPRLGVVLQPVPGRQSPRRPPRSAPPSAVACSARIASRRRTNSPPATPHGSPAAPPPAGRARPPDPASRDRCGCSGRPNCPCRA